ncbi:MAG: hypothetical protein AB7P99_09425 [Vicinamibacterales bacterium]
MTARSTATLRRAGTAAALTAVLVSWPAGPSAQRRRADSAAFGMPVTTTAITGNPEAFVGKLVTVSARVEALLTPTAFVVDQQRAVNAHETSAAGAPLLVLAPYLTRAVPHGRYVLLRGRVVRFAAAAIGGVAEGYTVDLPAGLAARYSGAPVLVATSVLDPTYMELGAKPLPPPTPAELAMGAEMKRIAASVETLRDAAQGMNVDGVAEPVATLVQSFGQVEAMWEDLGQSAAAEWAREARRQAVAIEGAAAGGDWGAVTTASGALNQTCQACHGAYRDRVEDGTFRMRPGSF